SGGSPRTIVVSWPFVVSTGERYRDRVVAPDRNDLAAPVADRRVMTWLLVAVTGYAGFSIMANVMSVRILRVGPDWASFSVDAGTLTYPLTFTLRDLVHKVGGRSAARVTIVCTAGLNVVAALAMWATANLPGDDAVSTPAQEWFGP